MRKILKWIGIVMAGLVILIVLAAAGLWTATTVRLGKRFTYPAPAVSASTDPAVVARGQHLVTSFLGCTECHGEHLQGAEFFNQPPLAVVYAPNLTKGQGGVGGTFTDADYARALRHGVDDTGRALFIMPSEDFTNLSDSDLAAVISYVRSVPAADNSVPEPQILPVGRIMIAAGIFGSVFAVDKIDHSAARPAAPPAVGSPDFGPYMVAVAGCRSCHGANLAGGQPGDPSSPPAPNLTPAGELGGWSEADFIHTIRTGSTPSGRQLSDAMPWKIFKNGSDEELSAIYNYLKTVPAVASK